VETLQLVGASAGFLAIGGLLVLYERARAKEAGRSWTATRRFSFTTSAIWRCLYWALSPRPRRSLD